MARFRATIKGSRGEASRLGTAKSGLLVHVNGWNVGICIDVGVNENDQEVFHIYRTGGSNRPGFVESIALIIHPDKEKDA